METTTEVNLIAPRPVFKTFIQWNFDLNVPTLSNAPFLKIQDSQDSPPVSDGTSKTVRWKKVIEYKG